MINGHLEKLKYQKEFQASMLNRNSHFWKWNRMRTNFFTTFSQVIGIIDELVSKNIFAVHSKIREISILSGQQIPMKRLKVIFRL